MEKIFLNTRDYLQIINLIQFLWKLVRFIVILHILLVVNYLLLPENLLIKLEYFLANLDLDEVDDKGKPKFPINMIVSAIKQIPELTKQLRAAEIAVSLEIEENSKIRGQKEKINIRRWI